VSCSIQQNFFFFRLLLFKSLFNNLCIIQNLGTFLAQSAKKRAFRFKSSEAPVRFLWAFRCNPLAPPSGGSGPV
jgi:hypothetical protein